MADTDFAPWPAFEADEIAVASTVLRSGQVNYWTGGEGRAFEHEFASWCGTRHAIALANGTVAIDLALKVLGVGAGDEVIVTPRTFLASVSCIVNAGARPVFADVDPDSQNFTARTIAPLISRRTRAIECVHLAGWPCEMDDILALAKHHGLAVIEDCAQAVGARYRDRSVGSLGHVAAWSFCQDKIITTAGEGGMLTTNDDDLWQNAWSYKDHGKSWEAVYERKHSIGFRWVHESFGTNWRLTEVQAAIGRIQLQKGPQWHAARRRNAETILAAARNCEVFRVPDVPAHIEHAWYKAYIFVEPARLKAGWSRDRLVMEINECGVPCSMGSCPEVYLEKAFQGTLFPPARRLPVARALGETSVMFLVHPTLRQSDLDRTCAAICDVGRAALR
jgi:dTDP-4-amino-4,6-dideoxygalactose transaminase